MRYTIQKFYRVSGGSTQRKGHAGYHHADWLAMKGAETGEKFEDNALPWDSIDAAKYALKSDDLAPFGRNY